MDKRKFISLLNNSKRSKRNSPQTIEAIIKQFPYCQTAYLLLAKERSLTKGQADELLKITAAYAGDREKLFELIKGPAKLQNLSKIKTDKKKTPIKQKKQKVLDTKTRLKSKTKIKLQVSRVKAKAVKKATGAQTQHNEQHVFLEWLSVIQETNRATVAATKPKIKSKPGKKKPVLKSKPAASKKIKEPDIHFNIAMPQHDELKIIEAYTKSKKKDSKKSNKGLDSIEYIAQKSIQEDANLISETLANIYMQQDKIDKAIQTYERLSLQHPKKKAYFAKQIKKLKRK